MNLGYIEAILAQSHIVIEEVWESKFHIFNWHNCRIGARSVSKTTSANGGNITVCWDSVIPVDHIYYPVNHEHNSWADLSLKTILVYQLNVC